MAGKPATPSTPAPALLHVQQLCAGYGAIPVLHDVSLTLHAGEIVGVLGHNGMGKTTLMKTLIGQLPATAGRIVLAPAQENPQKKSPPKVSLERLPAYQRARLGLGYVPQGRDIFPALTVRENLALAAVAAGSAGHARKAAAAAIDRALADFPRLAPLLQRKGGALSGGEQQILALARALCGQPRVLLLDEPSEGIQPSIVDDIALHLHRLASERGLAVLVVEQDVDFVRTLARRVLWLQKGHILRELAAAQLHDPVTLAEFVGLAS